MPEGKGKEGSKGQVFGRRSTRCRTLRKAYALGGRTGYLRAVLRLEKNEGVDPVRIAALYALLGERDESFTWLQKAYRQRSPWMELLKEHPYFDNLRADPRFRELIKQVGLVK